MSVSTSSSSGSRRIKNPTQDTEEPAKQKTEDSNSATEHWNTGITPVNGNESESIVINSSDISDENESSNSFENSSTAEASEQAWANRAVSKMNTPRSQETHVTVNPSQPHQHPSKFCLTGTGTSLGFTAAVAGFTATAFLYDVMTRFPEKTTTEISVAFGASIAIALGGTITCSNSLVFMIRELCKTDSA